MTDWQSVTVTVTSLPGDRTDLRERLDYELGVIRRMGYVDYFLIVWDFINYAKEHGFRWDRDEVPLREVSWHIV